VNAGVAQCENLIYRELIEMELALLKIQGIKLNKIMSYCN
jgi:hypothetical protein